MEAAWLGEGGVSIDMPQMAIRERTMWLTDHPGSTVEGLRPRAPTIQLCAWWPATPPAQGISALAQQ